MTTIGTYNLREHYKGDTWDGFSIRLYEVYPTTYLNLTGASVKMQFRKGKKNGALAKELTSDVDGGLVIANAAEGYIVFEPFEKDFVADTYYYDIQITFANGRVVTYLQGTEPIIQDTSF